MTVRRHWGCGASLALCGGFRGGLFWGHARVAGMGCVEHWIPACAGMTGFLLTATPFAFLLFSSYLPRRHSSEGWNPGRRVERSEAPRFCPPVPNRPNADPSMSFPLCGNGLYKPLDSGLRRNDGEGFQPSPARDRLK